MIFDTNRIQVDKAGRFVTLQSATPSTAVHLAFNPSTARTVAAALIAKANEIENTPEPTPKGGDEC